MLVTDQRSTWRAWLALRFVLIALVFAATTGVAPAQEGIIRRGDAVLTGFAGVRGPGPDLPPDVHPLDRTMIDLDGVTVRILDLSQLGGGPQGQLADAPVRFKLTARDVGHVFGIAFDGDGKTGPPNIFLAASSVHGLQLVAPDESGRIVRVMTGRPGARWMDGLFGGNGRGGPGSIWRVDGRTGAVTLFAEIGNAGEENSGAGLGSLAFDQGSKSLFVSDLETGLIWRLGLDGQPRETYDHGTTGRAAAGLSLVPYDPQSRTDRTQPTFNTELPETWGFAEPERRVGGLAVESGRLYYAVADGPQIWSVGLAADGSFLADARLEVDVSGTPAGHEVTSIVFDGPSIMYVAQRGARLGNYDYAAFSRPQESVTLRFAWSEAERRWGSAPQEVAIGLAPEHRGTLGGVALNYGYDRFGNIDFGRCRQTLWTTGEHLRAGSDIVRVTSGGPPLVHGLQGNYKHRVRPDNEPPLEAWYLDSDGRFDDAEAFGHVGNVAIVAPCEPASELTSSDVIVPVWVRGANLVVEKVCRSGALGGRVRCRITVRNAGDAVPAGEVEILDATRIVWGPAAGELLLAGIYAGDGVDWACGPGSAGDYRCTIPASVFLPGVERVIDVVIDTEPLLSAGNLGIRNCVAIRHPEGQGKACAEGGSGLVVTKTGPAECAPGAGCAFTLALTNPGTEPFAGDVLIADGLFVDGKSKGATIASISPPLGCAQEPGELPFACVANVALGPGETRAHTVVVTLPAPGNYWAQNCFAAFDAGLLANRTLVDRLLVPEKVAAPAKPAGSPSCTWIKVPAPAAKPHSGAPAAPATTYLPEGPPLTLLPPVWFCPDGRLPVAGGRCPCPLNAPFDPVTGRCSHREVCWDKVRLRPDGTCCPWGSVWWPQIAGCALPPPVGCRDVWRRAADGSCCPQGMRWSQGACRPIRIVTPCRLGQIRTLEGRCIDIGFPAPLPVIPVGVPAPRPTCPGGAPRLANGNCPAVACPGGARYNPATRRCESPQATGPAPDRPPAKCPGRLVLSKQGACVPPGLPPGLVSTLPPRRPPVEPPVVKGPATPPAIRCPGKLVPDARGACVPPSLVRPPTPAATTPVLPPPVKSPPKPDQATLPPSPGAGPGSVRCPGRLVPNAKGVCVPPGLGAGMPCPAGSFRTGPNAPCQPLRKAAQPPPAALKPGSGASAPPAKSAPPVLPPPPKQTAPVPRKPPVTPPRPVPQQPRAQVKQAQPPRPATRAATPKQAVPKRVQQAPPKPQNPRPPLKQPPVIVR